MHKQNKLFLTMYLSFIFAAQMLSPLYAIYVVKIGGDILAAGSALSIFMLISGLGILLMGKIEDKFKKDKPFIILGYSFISLGFLGYFFIKNTLQLFMVQVILGAGTMILVPARDSFYTKYLEKGRFASQWATWEGLMYIAGGIAALTGAFLAKIFGFRVLFLIMFFISLFGLAVATQLKDKNDH